jgi:hypothetical protein
MSHRRVAAADGVQLPQHGLPLLGVDGAAAVDHVHQHVGLRDLHGGYAWWGTQKREAGEWRKMLWQSAARGRNQEPMNGLHEWRDNKQGDWIR